MNTRRMICLTGVLGLLVLGTAAVASGQMLNPYLPHNAQAAEPPDPYNLDYWPKTSRTWYPPCPTCGIVSFQFPELPPNCQSFPGPFGIQVPVP